MVYLIKIKPFKDKNNEIYQHQSKYRENGRITKKKITKLLFLIFTITAAFVSVGLVTFTIYRIVKSHGESTADLSVTDLKQYKLQPEGYELMGTFDTTSSVIADFNSKVAIQKTNASELHSSTAINRSMPGLSFSDLDTSRNSSKEYTPEKTTKDKTSAENISHSEVILVNSEAVKVESPTRITKYLKQDCFKDCQTTRRPVCGSDNTTYSNECVLEIAACKSPGRKLSMTYRGPCRIRMGRVECCSEVKISSRGAARDFRESFMGRYTFHSIFDERPSYKSVRFEAFIVWRPTTNTWDVTRLLNSTTAVLYSTCNENCVEDCLFSHWKVSEGNNWINDDKVIIECNSNSGHDVDPCKENKPLEINNQKNGVILSPSMQNSFLCEWHIKADTGYIVKLTVLEFGLEGDWWMVHDGSSMSTPMIGSFSKNFSPIKVPLFSTGPDTYIVFKKRYSNSKIDAFKLRFDIEKCDWNDWEIGECSRTCGGGYQTKKRTLRNTDQSATNCGYSTLKEPCNVKSCTDPICKEFEILSKYLQTTFTLQTLIRNGRSVYIDSLGYYLYSTKDFGGSWIISLDIGSRVIFGRNTACKDELTPAGCKYGWKFAHRGRLVFDPTAKVNCKHFI